MASRIKQFLGATGAIALVVGLAACNSQKEPAVAANQTTAPAQSPASAPRETASDPAPTPTAAPTASACDAAANPKRCFYSEPFTVSIVNIDHTLGAYHVIRLNVEIRNVGKSPAIVAYQVNSGKAVDNLGNGYAVKTLPTGIPTDYGTRTDARLLLQPGEAHMSTFEAVGYRTPEQASSFNYDMTLDELGSDKPNPVQREHAVYFRDLTPAMPGK
jgi:hypothetical protein